MPGYGGYNPYTSFGGKKKSKSKTTKPGTGGGYQHPKPKPIDTKPILESLKTLEEYGWELEEDIEQLSKDVAIVKKENELQDIQLEEIKLKSNNPLSN